MLDPWTSFDDPARLPEVLASQAIKNGVPPPPIPGGDPLGALLSPQAGAFAAPLVPGSATPPEFNTAPPAASAPASASVGPPLDITPPGAAAPSMAGGGGMSNMAGQLQQTLKGVKAPPTPELPRVGTPAAPRPNPIRGGELLALMQLLGAAGGGAKGMPSLGALLGGR